MKLYIRCGELQDIVSCPGGTVEDCIRKAMDRAPGGVCLGRYFEVSEQGFDSIHGEWDVHETLEKLGFIDEV